MWLKILYDNPENNAKSHKKMPKEQNTIKITKEWYHMATTLGPTTLSPVKPFFFWRNNSFSDIVCIGVSSYKNRGNEGTAAEK